MRAGPRLFALLLALLGVALPAAAQTPPAPVTLLADEVRSDAEGRLIAEGAVEIRFEGNRLLARAITYDPDTDRLSVTGPMRILADDGTVFMAESAELSRDLRDGLIRSARMVLDQRMQLAAGEAMRVEGRYTVLDKAVASSCRICAAGGAPLWRIRASRVIYDRQKQRLHFSNPRLEVAGTPVIWLPALSLPGPGVERARGFLVPRLSVTNNFGAGIEIPYFVPLGRSADLTFTPFIAEDESRTLNLRFRQATRRGQWSARGAVSDDNLTPGTRAYLFAEGSFALPRDFRLDFGLQAVSDRAYLSDYGISETDRLESPVTVSRYRRDEILSFNATHYRTLRTGESNETQPSKVVEGRWLRRGTFPVMGGIATGDVQMFGFTRDSDADIIGRDVARISGIGNWTRRWSMAAGLRFGAEAQLAVDQFFIGDDSGSQVAETRLTPALSGEMRWPLSRTLSGGAIETLEPVAQLVWSEVSEAGIPNEDSRVVEFDEGNLFALSRFAGSDEREEGLRANLGATWTHRATAGWTAALTAGRVLRFEDEGQFAAGTGLDDTASDWLVAAQLSPVPGFVLTNRGLIEDGLDVTTAELRADWVREDLDLSTSYLWQQNNPAAGLAVNTSQWIFDAGYEVVEGWTGRASWRYDFTSGEAIDAGLGIGYRNECVEVDFSVSRDFTESDTVRPSTDIGLSVTLTGFGSDSGGRRPARSCMR